MKRNAVAWAALAVSLAAFAGSRVPTRTLPASQEPPTAEGQLVARQLSNAFNAVAEHVRPSVVQINVESKRPAPRRPGRGGRPEAPKDEDGPPTAFGLGSGFVFDDRGHILTNNHVVEGAERMIVSFHDGVHLPAEVVGTFPEADVAVIKVETTEYRPLRRGSSRDLKVGEWVLAVGSPFGLSQTVTAGIVSATQRENVNINDFESFIQTDCAINRGNSGGPLVDLDGKVVGINSAIATGSGAASSAGVGFAIPIDMATRLAEKLIRHGKIEPALMGVVIDPLSRGLARQLGLDPTIKGVVVLEVGPSTPADKAGLKIGDIITRFDGEPVQSRKALRYLVMTSDIGQEYELNYVRGGQSFAARVSPAPLEQVALVMQPTAPPVTVEAEPEEATSDAVNGFGLAVAPLDEKLAEKYKWDVKDGGLVVTAVEPGTPAEAAGIEPGDRITKFVEDKAIRPAQSAREFDAAAKDADELAVYVEDVNRVLPGEFKTLRKAETVKN